MKKHIFISRKNYLVQGFSLFEVVLVILLLSVMAGVGIRAIQSMDQAKRFRSTTNAMNMIRKKLIGNPRIFQTGHRTDFGYWGIYGAFPSSLNALDAAHYVTPRFEWLTRDAWGNNYLYDNSSIGITSGAAADGSSFDADISVSINKNAFNNNDLRVYCVDRAGGILLGGGRHIGRINVTTCDGSARDLSYSTEGFWYENGSVKAGLCIVRVYFASAARANELCGKNDANYYAESADVVYPGRDSGRMNVCEMRFPGEAT